MERIDGYARIQDYAAIGDGRALALVASDGSIDWLALPRLDSPTVFARLLDPDRGGAFELAPTARYEVAREYVGNSNVLQTTFTTEGGSVRVTDAITLDHGGLLPWFELVRRVEGLTGSIPLRWRITPRFAAGEQEERPRFERVGGAVAVKGEKLVVTVHSFGGGEPICTEDEIGGSFESSPGSAALIVLRATQDEPIPAARHSWVARRVNDTADDWARWLDDAAVEGEWEDATRRSALVLRMLTYVPSGAIVAAPTTSLPERIGGDRNYDYRFAWVRDTAYTLDALINLELLVQVHASFAWLLGAVERTEPDVHVFYDLDGETASGEKELELRGYRGSRPLWRGNKAAGQLQLGCYGDLLETAELYVRDGNALDDTTAKRLAGIVDELAKIWKKKDSGIWELDDKQHYTSSKVGAWLAFARALKLVEENQLPAENADRWRESADDAREFVERECWSDDRGAYVMYAGADKLDASLLRMARIGFVDPQSDRLRSTVDAIRRELSAGGPLLYRYSGQEQVEGAFVACSFWLVEALAREGQLEKARSLMRELVGLANDVGLYSEQIDPLTGEFLGNFPQGLSHLALVNAAAAIAREESR